MATDGKQMGSKIAFAAGSGGNVALPDIGRVPDYVLEPVDLAKPLTDAQREERFQDRLLQLEYEEREMSWSLKRMRVRAKAETQRLARGPKRWHRARDRAEEWERLLFSEISTPVALRHRLQAAEGLTWIDTGRADVLRFARPNGWQVVTNFGTEPYPLPGTERLLASSPAPAGVVPGETTVWLAPAD